MSLSPVSYRPIGIIHSAHQVKEKIPAQPIYAQECLGTAEILPEFLDGLRDIEEFSHIYLVFHLHEAGPPRLIVKPFLQPQDHGIFATRAPSRPNPIGLSIVELVKRVGNILHFRGCDILDGTPLLDIKPYTRRFDHIATQRNGWQDQVDDQTAGQRGLRDYQGSNGGAA
ncbi:MAG: tRNA (N6-threonylcarbamoyladenosine(37)-N6)-methyltransferase TrmO [Deltaproteobacteria bacterium]|nr:tRNA (N6-threonylcarbamoyladenosine(37)-N6)-methyltransferase TrmO [Deltaproteobacteria bacterium]